MTDSDTKIWLMKVTQESRSQSENLMYEKEPSISYFTNYNPNIEEIYYRASRRKVHRYMTTRKLNKRVLLIWLKQNPNSNHRIRGIE